MEGVDMALRTVRVFLHNETTSQLNLTGATLDEGAWGDDGRQHPPQTIAPQTTVMMRSESSGFPPAGTEAHVTYRIGSDSTENVALHWDNPLVDSNSYHQNTDFDHFVFRAGGTGNDAVVHFYLRPAGPRSTGFLPDRDGFKFSNHWPNTPYSLPPLKGTVLDYKYGNASNGLCGGMVFAARDYFEEGRSIPAVTTAPVGEQDPLFLYLVDRLFATFSVDSVSLMLKLMNPLYPDTDENVLGALGLAAGRSSVMANEEWPLIRADIEEGRPSPLALITVKSTLPWDLGKCHQVLAYAYDVHGDDILLRVYDPNQPLINDVTMRFNVRTVAEPIRVQHNIHVFEDDGASLRPIYCFARMNYAHRTPTVPTPPRPPRPPVEVPRQVSVEFVGSETLLSSVVEHGRKKFQVLMCEEREFDFTRVIQQQRVTLRAHAISYIDPQVTWVLNDVPVPPGANQTLHPHPSEPGDTYFEAGAGALAQPSVTVTTTTDGMLLHVVNTLGDGQYGLTGQAFITERDGSERRTWKMSFTFLGTKEIVPGLAQAADRCFAEWIKSLQQEAPSMDAIIAMIYAQLGRPPDPLWDPDPLQLLTDWQDAVIDPDQALFVDGSQQVDPSTVIDVPTTDSGRVIVTRATTNVVTIDPGTDGTVQVGTDNDGVTVINTTSRAVVVVDESTHEAVALIPANAQAVVGVAKRLG
jgi:hypothetical protein